MSNSQPERFRPHLAFVCVFAALLAGLIVSCAVALLPLSGLRMTAHFSLAFVMGALIAASFMGLRHSGQLMRVFALGALLWLLFLFVVAPVDYLTR